MPVAFDEVGVARMLVVGADRLVERDRRQVAAVDRGDQVLLVLEMLRLGLAAVGELLEVGERLVVELERWIGLAGQGVVPAAGVPGPADALVREAIADRRHVLRR
jgi:hypothetical protein